jgi:hypothetical protein
MQDTISRPTPRRAESRWLRPLALLILILLATQFLVGMLVNFFVQIPDAHPGANAPEYFSGVAQGVAWALANGAAALKFHAIIGLLLFLDALVILGLAIAARRRAWIIAGAFGLFGIMAAGFNGASFMNYGHDFSSLLMAIGFLWAVIAYAIGYYVTGVNK